MADFKRASLTLLTASVVPIAALPAASATLPQKIISVPLIRDTELTAYFGEFQIGTPPQKELVKLDTGSPYYGFLNPRNSACTSDPNACTTFGTFDNLTSSTCFYDRPGFNDALSVGGTGDYLNDTITLGGVTVPHLSFGYVSRYNNPHRVFPPINTVAGLSLDCQFGGPTCTSRGAYLLAQLKNASVIDRMATSFYLGPDDASVPSARMIVGGAYDKAKIEGELFTVKMLNPFDLNLANGQTNTVNVTAMEFVRSDGNITAETYGEKDIGVPVLLDTGIASWYMTDTIFDVVWRALGAFGTYVPGTRVSVIDCKYRDPSNSKGHVSVTFGTAGKIDVPLYTLVSLFSDGTCGTFIAPRGDVPATLGDPFLRGAYTIFDQESLSITLGQVKHTDDEEIVPFPEGGFKASS